MLLNCKSGAELSCGGVTGVVYELTLRIQILPISQRLLPRTIFKHHITDKISQKGKEMQKKKKTIYVHRLLIFNF
jgi:hypothetical protein